ncbi:MAG: aminomethyl-transferring glycine dehydrogenase subunit GcvPA [Alphaproteobacteria bacterium]|nr:aminomethyl-transferring glycine dehydrogenase subunit GcvPA [Alphaproteobacteria bacterium]MBV8548996.1 aminomethyl-transferring glycine dehydrogenase subunit GcvPA [Alphaproteobacteria bacterium]
MRYLPLTEKDRTDMLAAVGVASVDDLFRDVPQAARLTAPISGLPNHQPEYEVDRHLSRLAAKNVSAGAAPFFLGAGAYRHHVPASVDQLLLRGEFLTSYTPYQPEVSQGTLQMLFEFQTQVCMLTGMDVANASMYDGSTACAEAVQMANRVTKRSRAVLSGNLHPHYRDTVVTTADLTGFELTALPPAPAGAEDLAKQLTPETSCVVVQNPDFFGRTQDLSMLAEACHAVGTLLVVVVTEVISLGALASPGSMGADIVVAEGQGIGNGLNFGGPYVGLFACKEKYMRQMPGRLCGQTKDAEGRRGFVLTLSAREQHIRREKATSNICTNSGLCALAFTMHLSLLGETGLRHLAALNHARACQLADKINAVAGCSVLNETFFNEFTVALPKAAAPLVDVWAKKPLLAGVPVSRLHPGQAGVENLLLVTVTELTTDADMDALIAALKEIAQ